MISHKHKFIFIHTPKTAGNSIQHVLINYSENKMILPRARHPSAPNEFNKDIFERFDMEDEHIKGDKHTTLSSYYNGWRKAGYANIEDYFKFGCIRNPWDRAISYYFWKERKSFSKKSFISRCLRLCPMVDSFKIKNNGLNKVDFFIRLERLQEDFDVACGKIGIDRHQLPRINQSKHKHYTEYYDDETRRIVAERYVKDIEYFGYKFGE